MSDKFGYIDIGCGNGCGCNPCTDCQQEEGCLYPSFTDCVTYNNGFLPNIGLPVSPDTTCTVTDIIKKIDDIIGQLSTGSAADWTTYNVDCLAPITTQKQFVEKISSQFCTLKSGYNTFTTVTYITDKTNLQNQINDLKNPSLTSAGCLSIVNTDTQKQIDTKLISKVESICSSLDISSVTWDSCITTSSTPSTVKEGFIEVLSQICTVKSLIDTSGQDTYKVLTSSADTTPDYISNKITTSPCLTSEITSDNKLKLGLSFTPPIYSFDDNVFVTTTGLQEDCGQNIIVSLKDTPGIGTVTSIDITSDDLSVTGSPITSSGTIDLALKDILADPGNFNNVTVNSKGQVVSGTLVPYLTSEEDPTVPDWVKQITQTDINNWNNNSSITIPVASDTVLGAIKVGDDLKMTGDVLSTAYSQGYGIEIDSNYIIGLTSSVQTSLAKANTALQNITGYITAGSNISISGSGTSVSPYVISSTASGGGGIGYTDLSATAPLTYDNNTGQFGITKATVSQDGYLDSTDFVTFNNKQDKLVSGVNIKTINGTTLLGSGDITISGGTSWGSIGGTLSDQTDLQSELDNKEDLITGAATSITSSNLTGNRALISNTSGKVSVSNITDTELGYLDGVTSSVQTQINGKQETLVSGTNIKTINGTSLLGTGDITISGGTSWGSIGGTLSNQTDLQSALNGKEDTITGAATTITSSNLTVNRALISNASGKVAVSAVTNTEVGYLSGVTSSIQTQVNSKQATLVSGTNIKTINGNSLLGSGNITISTTGGQVDSVVAGTGVSVDNTDPVNPIISATGSITGNGYNYGRTVTNYAGFSTNGGAAYSPIVYNISTTTGNQITVQPSDYQYVIIGANESAITLPDPSQFLGRVIRFKIKNESNVTLFPGNYIYHGDVLVNQLAATSTNWVVLVVMASNSTIHSSAVWEVVELNTIDESLYA